MHTWAAVLLCCDHAVVSRCLLPAGQLVVAARGCTALLSTRAERCCCSPQSHARSWPHSGPAWSAEAWELRGGRAVQTARGPAEDSRGDPRQVESFDWCIFQPIRDANQDLLSTPIETCSAERREEEQQPQFTLNRTQTTTQRATASHHPCHTTYAHHTTPTLFTTSSTVALHPTTTHLTTQHTITSPPTPRQSSPSTLGLTGAGRARPQH